MPPPVRLPLEFLLLACAFAPAAARSQGGTAPDPQRDTPQGTVPQGTVATFVLDGERTAISDTQLAIEFALHFRLRPEGQEVIDFLIDTSLVEIEARERGVKNDAAEIDAYWKALGEQLEAQGTDLDEFLASRGTTRADYEDEIAIGLNHRKLTMAAIGLPRADMVTADMQKLWLKEARTRHDVVTDPDALPPGVVAKVDDRAFGLLEMGRMLMRTQTIDAQQERIRKLVARRVIRSEAEAAGIELTDEEVDREIAVRKAEAEANPRYKGVPFENLLQSQGHTLATLRASPDFRAQLQLLRLVELEHPDEELRERLRNHRDEVLAHHGAARKFELIFLRAAEEASELMPRTFEAAEAELDTIREAVEAGTPFGAAARSHSDHPPSRVRDGVLGWLHRADETLPAAVVAAAFETQVGDMTPVVTADDGAYLVRVAEVEPPPPDDALLKRMRAALVERRTIELYQQADIHYAIGQ